MKKVLWLPFICIILSCQSVPGAYNTNAYSIDLNYMDENGEYEYEKTYVKYEYSNNKLYITQYNAAFNCSPRLYVDFSLIGNEIKINKTENGDAECLDVFELKLVIDDITPQKYKIKINDLYKLENEEPIEFLVDFNLNTNGLLEYERKGYPWIDHK